MICLVCALAVEVLLAAAARGGFSRRAQSLRPRRGGVCWLRAFFPRRREVCCGFRPWPLLLGRVFVRTLRPPPPLSLLPGATFPPADETTSTGREPSPA